MEGWGKRRWSWWKKDGQARLVAYVVGRGGGDAECAGVAAAFAGEAAGAYGAGAVCGAGTGISVAAEREGESARRCGRWRGCCYRNRGWWRRGRRRKRSLAEIWKELLKVEEVGVEQNFFELGGHSLLVLQVIARIRRMFEVELAVRTVFEEPTMAGLARAVEKAEAQGLKAQTPILQRRPRAEATTAPSREALLAQLDQLSADDIQTLLKRALDGKQTAPLRGGPELQ